MSSRVFHQLLSRVGDQGRYQVLMITLGCVLMLEVTGMTYMNAYLFYEDDFVCPQKILNCKEFVCTLPPQQQIQYINPDFSSLATKFGNHRCQGSSQLSTIQSFIYVGSMAGVVIGLLLAQWLTQRQTLLVMLFVANVGLGLAMVGPEMWVAGVGLFLCQASRSVAGQLITSIISDVVSQQWRVTAFLIIECFYAFGVMLVGGVYWVIHPWYLAVLLYHALPTTAVLLLLFWLGEETTLEQITRFTPEESQKAFSRIAKINGVNPQITRQEIVSIREAYRASFSEHRRQTFFTVCDFFRYQSLRAPTIILLIFTFFLGYQNNSTQLLLQDYAGNFYLNSILIGLSSPVCMFIGLFIIKVTPRRVAIIVTETIGAILGLGLFIWLSCRTVGECSEEEVILQTIGLFIYRTLVALAYSYLYLVQIEFYPSQIKHIAVIFMAIPARLSIVLIPLIQQLFNHIKVSILLTFAVSSVAAAVLGVFFPQTFQIPPPEMIKELAQARDVRRQEIKSGQQF